MKRLWDNIDDLSTEGVKTTLDIWVCERGLDLPRRLNGELPLDILTQGLRREVLPLLWRGLILHLKLRGFWEEAKLIREEG
jgi:hypothetical protein